MKLTPKHAEVVTEVLQKCFVGVSPTKFIETDDEYFGNYLDSGGLIIRNVSVDVYTPEGKNEVMGFSVDVCSRQPDRDEQPGCVDIIQMGTFARFEDAVAKVFRVYADWCLQSAMESVSFDIPATQN